jgi:hypothetical protein
MTDGSSDGELRHASRRIEELLDEVKEMAGPLTWRRVEELVERMVDLYGSGLARILAEIARGDDALLGRLLADELVESLLLLHGLHPVSLEERVERALAELRSRLAVRIESVGLSAEGGLTLRVFGGDAAAAERVILRALERAAPDLVAVRIESPETGLVQLGGLRAVGARSG